VRRFKQGALSKGAVAGALIAAALFAACANVNPLGPLTGETVGEQAQEIEPMLAEAGFETLNATTPEQKLQLKTLPPLKLGYYRDNNGAANYWMADPDYCNCLMHGDEAAYQRYEDNKLEHEVAQRDREEMQARQQQQMMMMPPPGFGPGFGSGFGPGFGSGFGFSGGSFGFSF